VKVASPLGEYPFVFQKLERREGGVAIVGTMAGIEASILLDDDDLRTVAKAFAAPLAVAAILIAWRSRRRRSG
jgi:hypothetical protein